MFYKKYSWDIYMSGAARIGDAHACPQTGHGVNSIVSGDSTVLINGIPAATVDSSTACGGSIISGSSTVTIGGKPAAILGSATSHGGVIICASGNVLL
jgi:uncharacterized Zn-binding protein involved in type VI secretion